MPMPRLLPASGPCTSRRRHSVRMRPAVKLLWWLSAGNLAGAMLLLMLVRFVSEGWWLSTALVYLPRSPFLLPSLILLPCTCVWQRRAAIVNLAAVLLIAGPVMGLRLNPSFPDSEATSEATAERRLCVVTCNVQAFRPSFDLVLRELSAIRPDIVVFQEAIGNHPLLAAFLDEWHTVWDGEFLIASRFPVRQLATNISQEFNRVDVVRYEVDGPYGPLLIYNVHQTTARFGLATLQPRAIFDEGGHSKLDAHIRRRETEAIGGRAFVEEDRTRAPVLILGDFNMPVESSLYQACWGDIPNAFDQAGSGYGFTAPCHTRRHWPDSLPWARVDHILCSEHWSVQRCWSGSGNGSDHRLVAAIVKLLWRHPAS